MTIYFQIKRVHITDLILTIENVEQEDRYDSGGDGGQGEGRVRDRTPQVGYLMGRV